MQVAEVLKEIRPRLEQAFGPRFRGVLLYGSRARGDAGPDSDMDLMVLLEGPINLLGDIKTAVDATYPLQLEVDFPFNMVPADVRDFESQEFGLHRSAKQEGILL